MSKSTLPYRAFLRPEESRALSLIEPEIEELKERLQKLRDRRCRIVNRAVLRARNATAVSRVTNRDSSESGEST